MPEKFKVVISGISGRFPESNDLVTFKENLYNGYDFVTTDNRKWPVGYKDELVAEKKIPDAVGKFPDNYQKFDYGVFKLSKLWSLGHDILNSVVFEPSFEAIVDAGINPYSLDGSNVGVFISSGKSDIDYPLFKQKINSHAVIAGCSKSMVSNRISYVLNLKGTSHTNYSEVHGGLDSLAMAYKYVSEGFGEAAIVGAVSSIVNPRNSLSYAHIELLCPDGITRPFDESANGYARSECVVCFYIQRAEDAKRNYGEIKLCDFSYLGSQLPSLIGYDAEYLKMAWNHLVEVNNFIFDPSNVAFIEMNAFGLKFLDKVESNAVAEWFSKNNKKPLMVGSVKSNVGHTEEGAGLMAILKALLALDSGTVSPNLHLKTLNKDIKAFEENRLQVVTENTPLEGNLIAVNTVGLFGSVGLALIQQHDSSAHKQLHDEAFPRILLLSGREETKLLQKLEQIANMPCTPEFIALANDSFQQNMPLHVFRGFTLLPSSTISEAIINVETRGEVKRPVWFIFTGMGSQWNGMGRDLLNLPLFAETVAKCDRVLKTKDIDIYKILTSDDSTLFDNIINSFVGIITVQIGLCEILKALGVEPEGIIGHSVGENGCAYADGCVTLEEAVLLSWARGKASVAKETIKGMMAAVGMGYAQIKNKLPEDIQVACHNSADSCTISGPAESVDTYVKELKKEGVFARSVNVANIAYHSKYIKPIGSELLQTLKQIIKEPRKRSTKWISTSFPESEWDHLSTQYFSAEYATNNLLSPVLFEEGCKHIPENAICIEIAPHGLLQAILKKSLPSTCTNIPLTRRAQNNMNNLNFLLSSIGKLYIAGLEPRVNNIFPKVEYPVPRGTPGLSSFCTWYHSDDPIPYHLQSSFYVTDRPVSREQIPICVRYDSDYVYLKDHRINEKIAVPPSFFMYLIWRVFSFTRMEELGSSSIFFDNVKIHNNIIVEMQDLKYVSFMIQSGSGNFEVILRDEEDSEDFQVILTGSINLMLEETTTNSPYSSTNQNTGSLITKSRFYNAYKYAGYSLKNEFSQINDLRHQDTGYETTVTWTGNWVGFLDALMKVQTFANHDGNVRSVFPSGLSRLEIPAEKFSSLKNGDTLVCTIDSATSELFCNGARMHGLKYKMLPKLEIKQLREFRFVSHQDPQCQNVHEFLNLCLQIAVESADRLNGLLVLDRTKQYIQIVEQIINECDFPESIVVSSHSRKESSHASGCRPIFIITDKIEDHATFDASTTNELILYISQSDFSSNDPNQMKKRFIEVTKQSFSANTFTLLKRVRAQNSRENSHKRRNFYFFRNRNEEMESKMNAGIDETKPYFVVRNDIELGDIPTIVKMRKHSNTRYLFLMDQVRSQKKLDELVQMQVSMDLPVSIFQRGVWGSYRNIISKNDNEKIRSKEFTNSHQPSSISAGDGLEEINYICVHNENSQNGCTKQLSGVSFATNTNNGVKIGLARSSQTEKLIPDEHLFWIAPSNWLLEEAVTVTYFYAQAYNLLNPLNWNHHIKTVMINVGTEHFLAEAVITLALYKNQTVLVTVGNDAEAILLQQKFPKLTSRNIFRIQNYEIQIRTQMKGEGVHLVINCLPGIQHVDACLRCVGKFGVYTEVGNANCSDLFDAGLYDFLKSVSLRQIQNRVTDLLKLPVDTKMRLRKFLEECIGKGVVVPLQMTQQKTSVLSTVTSKPLKILKHHPGVENSNSYMIVGTSIKDGSLVDLVKWLALKGARKFIIALEEHSLPSSSHPLQRILSQMNLQIIFISASKLEDKPKARSFIKETEKFGALETIFFVSIKIVGKKLSNLDTLVSPTVRFVGLFSSGLKEFECRNAKGSPAIFIYSDDGKSKDDISTIIPQLDELLVQKSCHTDNAGVLYHATYGTSYEHQNTNNIARPNLRDYFPYNHEMLAMIGENEAVGLGFVEMSSLSKKYVHCIKDIYPMFVLPAVHRVTLKPLIERLLQPVFAVASAPVGSIKYIARELYQCLNKVQRMGPITIISETWTLPLALEVASHARLDNRKYRIFALEGNPIMWSEQADRLRQASNLERFKTTYADEILRFGNNKMNDGGYAKDFTSFEEEVELFVRNEADSVRKVQNVIRANKIVQTKLDELARTQLTDRPLENVTFFGRFCSEDRLLNLSVTSEVIVLNEKSYRDLLTNRNVSQTINEKSKFSWRIHTES